MEQGQGSRKGKNLEDAEDVGMHLCFLNGVVWPDGAL